MSNKLKPSYDFGTQPYPTPQQTYEISPDSNAPKTSYDFTTQTTIPTDYVSRASGGIFGGKVRYSSHFIEYGDFDLITKKFVVDSIAAIDLSATDAHTRGLFGLSP